MTSNKAVGFDKSAIKIIEVTFFLTTTGNMESEHVNNNDIQQNCTLHFSL